MTPTPPGTWWPPSTCHGCGRRFAGRTERHGRCPSCLAELPEGERRPCVRGQCDHLPGQHGPASAPTWSPGQCRVCECVGYIAGPDLVVVP